jgi:Asp-tRNA(Asn)/Glu-tRNA(Gln) amidotransferase A subunit family amidase
MIGPEPMGGGEPGAALSGTRFAVKDLFDVAGTPTGAGNPDWLDEAPVARSHAPAVLALLAAGADLWGKTVTDELAFSLSGTNVHYGMPTNPAAPGRIPGGSSSGSAAAVAGGMVDLALGTDTGGSIRVPASYCGAFGLRPTHGRIDMLGVVPLARSFDTVGLLATDGSRLAAGWGALSAGAESTRPAATPRSLRRLVLAADLFELADAGCADALDTAVRAFALALDLEVVTARLAPPGELPRWLGAFRSRQMIEAWEAHGEWIRRRQPDFGPGIAERFAVAASTDPDEGAAARSVPGAVGLAFERVLGSNGVLVQPAASGPAPLVAITPDAKQDLRARTLLLTAPAGLAGAPVVVMPLARAGEFPLGVAFVGLPGDDEALVELAARSDGLVVPPTGGTR